MIALSLFNRQVLQCQDDAYTLAWYLLGDEAQAEAVTQAAAEATYPCFASNRTDCRLLILKQVVEQCRRRKLAACSLAEPGIFHDLHFLVQQERVVLVLIDILGLCYTDASRITGASIKETGRLLTQARRRMIKPIFKIERGGR